MKPLISEKNMKILITGGAGYIGNILTDHLLQNGFNVTVYDNLIHKHGGILENCRNKKFTFIYGDVRDENTYREVINKHDIIVNLAGYVGVPICKRFPIETVQVNRTSAEFLSKTISKHQIVIFSSTNSVYGTGKDDKSEFCDEETPITNTISLYAKTKAEGESALMQTGNTIAFRFATVFGTSRKMRTDLLVNDFVWRAWNDRFIVLFESHFKRNSIHIQDVAHAIYFAIINHKVMKGNIYNAGNSEINISKLELCHAIKKQVPDFFITESEINKDPDQRNYIVLNKKLETLGWKCTYSLDDGIRELLMACPIIKNTNIINI